MGLTDSYCSAAQRSKYNNNDIAPILFNKFKWVSYRKVTQELTNTHHITMSSCRTRKQANVGPVT